MQQAVYAAQVNERTVFGDVLDHAVNGLALGEACDDLGALLGAVFLAGLGFTEVLANEYYYTAVYAILQATMMAVAWNILGGFTGYVNFGSAGFFAIGAYTAVALDKWLGLPLPLLIIGSAIICGLMGLGVGYLTLRLKGVYFAIATLALAIVLETLITNWDYVGAARGVYILTPDKVPFFDSYIQLLFVVMLALTLGSIAVSRQLNDSRIGRGLAAILASNPANPTGKVIGGNGRIIAMKALGWTEADVVELDIDGVPLAGAK